MRVVEVGVRDPSLHILQHALGLDDYGQGAAYRNHFVTGDGSDDFSLCMEHVAAGRMVRSGPSDLYGGASSFCFTVTEAGRTFVRETSPRPPKLTRSQQRYRAYLDDDSGLTFIEWLRASAGRCAS